jgi:Zn finger protein HypA/HybF involved in hydrogenase expression
MNMPMYCGCPTCGHLRHGDHHKGEECPDCHDGELVLGLGRAVFNEESLVKEQKQYCLKHGIDRDFEHFAHRLRR